MTSNTEANHGQDIRAALAAAAMVAAGPALNNSNGRYSAYVRWADIESLRQALDQLGIDWRKVCAQLHS